MQRPSAFWLSLACLLSGGCNTLFGPEVRDEPALIIYHGDTTTIEAPATVPVGTSFTVSIATFGGGCTRDIARTDVRTPAADLVEIMPINRTRVPRGANSACTDDLLFLRHSVTVHASAVGPLTLRVRGVQRGGDTGSSTGAATLQRTVSVE